MCRLGILPGQLNVVWSQGSKEISSISVIFFYFSSLSDCHQGALCFLIRIVSYDPKFKEVFRDVGVLEVLTYCLKQYAADLKEKRDGKLMDLLILIGANIICT